MAKHTLEELEGIAKEKFPVWEHVIDEEPTLFKNISDKAGKDVVVVIDEEGIAVGINRDSAELVDKESWNGSSAVLLYTFNEELRTFEPNPKATPYFDEETLSFLVNTANEWMELIG